jgi:hypothetical protein
LPRPSPLTQADIKARSQLTGLPKFAAAKGDVQPKDLFQTEVAFTKVMTEADGSKRVRKEIRGLGRITDEMRQFAGNWNFSAAIDTLGLRHIKDRRRCEDELILICVNNKLAMLAEAQETPGRKARAFQFAPRWQKERMQEQKSFWRKAQNIEQSLAEEFAEQDVRLALGRQALRLWEKRPWLPQSLEQEAVRALGRIPQSRDDFALLRKQMMQQIRKGGYKSWALRNTIHALQACAATWNKKLIWDKNRRAPPKQLLKFLVQVLRAAKIKHPNPKENYSKFVALMLRPPPERQIERSTVYSPSEAERRLAKVFL